MTRRRIIPVVLLLLAISTQIQAANFEPPLLADRVAAGELDAMQDRLPLEPLISRHAEGNPKYGGTMHLLFSKSKDIRQMVIYGYARLVGYDENLKFKADILKDFTVEEGRIFTFHLREGHRWSDGQPFTTEALINWTPWSNRTGTTVTSIWRRNC